MPEKKWERIFDINVALKVIKHISTGIYRTPGGAIKELVNNSFDAQATEVVISSGFPKYSKLEVTDNGMGLTKETVDRSFELVGSSVKVAEPEQYEGKIHRPIIGQFGVGMLAAANVSRNIQMLTYPKGEDYGLEVRLDLNPFFEYESQVQSFDQFQFGSVRYRPVEREGHAPGTTVELLDIRPDSDFYKTISRKTYRYVEWPAKGEREPRPGDAMRDFVNQVDEAGVRTVEELSGRERLLWELGLICPVEYLHDGPVKKEYLDARTSAIIERMKEELKRLRFKVYYDGVEIRKPILLPTSQLREREAYKDDLDKLKDIRVYPIQVDLKKAGVKAEGYLLWQPYNVHPQELRGLYPRLRNVGVGVYDATLFKAIAGERPLMRVQLSGELYVLEGLRDALDLDRSGFLELDEGFQALRSELVDVIRAGDESIVKRVGRALAERNKRRVEIKERKVRSEVQAEIATHLGRVAPTLKAVPRKAEEIHAGAHVVSYGVVAIDHSKKSVYVDEESADPLLIAVIVAIDEYLGSLPEGEEHRQEMARRIREVLGFPDQSSD